MLWCYRRWSRPYWRFNFKSPVPTWEEDCEGSKITVLLRELCQFAVHGCLTGIIETPTMFTLAKQQSSSLGIRAGIPHPSMHRDQSRRRCHNMTESNKSGLSYPSVSRLLTLWRGPWTWWTILKHLEDMEGDLELYSPMVRGLKWKPCLEVVRHNNKYWHSLTMPRVIEHLVDAGKSKTVLDNLLKHHWSHRSSVPAHD